MADGQRVWKPAIQQVWQPAVRGTPVSQTSKSAGGKPKLGLSIAGLKTGGTGRMSNARHAIMHKIIGVILLIVGIFLLLQGHDFSRAFNAQLKNLFTGSPSSRVTWYYLGGAICCAVGLVEFFRSDKK